VILESNKNIPKEEIERQKADLLNWEESINRTEKMIGYSNNVWIDLLIKKLNISSKNQIKKMRIWLRYKMKKKQKTKNSKETN